MTLPNAQRPLLGEQCLIPLCLAIILAIFQIFFVGDIDGFQITLCSILIGLSALVFVYLGKMQACNDVIRLIVGCVYMGEKEELLKAMSYLYCLGRFKEIIQHAKQFL